MMSNEVYAFTSVQPFSSLLPAHSSTFSPQVLRPGSGLDLVTGLKQVLASEVYQLISLQRDCIQRMRDLELGQPPAQNHSPDAG